MVKIVILCYYVSISYQNNYCKNIQNIKNCWALPTPPSGGGVWCDIPAVNLEPLLTRWHDWKVNKYRGSRPWGQSLLRYQPVCLWYHYTRSLNQTTQYTLGLSRGGSGKNKTIHASSGRGWSQIKGRVVRGLDATLKIVSGICSLTWDSL